MTFLAVFKADYRQRLRDPSFGLILLTVAFFSFLMFPGGDAKYAIMDVFGYRGEYNSAWIGDTLAVLNSLVTPLLYFYLIKNAIALDRKSHVDVLLASSPLKKYNYILGKWLSNVSLVATLVLLMNAVAILKQLYLGESYTVDIVAQFRAQVTFALPFLLITAGIALLFESLPVLRGGIGNMAYLFVWMPMLVVQIEANLGAALIIEQMEQVVGQFADISENVSIGGSPIAEPLKTFVWNGAELNAAMGLSALYVGAAALFVLLLTVLVFRFKVSNFNLPKFGKGKAKKEAKRQSAPAPASSLTPLGTFKQHFGALPLLRGELRLMFGSHKLIWYVGAAGLSVAAVVAPINNVLAVILPITALWGTLTFSQLGCRDKIHDTEVLMGVTHYGVPQRLVASWLSGAALQLALFAGLFARFMLEGLPDQSAVLLVAVLFIPALAICLGRISGTTRTFEFIYILLWYIGPMDHTPGMDFLGTELASRPPAAAGFLVATGILIAVTLSVGHRGLIAKALQRA